MFAFERKKRSRRSAYAILFNVNETITERTERPQNIFYETPVIGNKHLRYTPNWSLVSERGFRRLSSGRPAVFACRGARGPNKNRWIRGIRALIIRYTGWLPPKRRRPRYMNTNSVWNGRPDEYSNPFSGHVSCIPIQVHSFLLRFLIIVTPYIKIDQLNWKFSHWFFACTNIF